MKYIFILMVTLFIFSSHIALAEKPCDIWDDKCADKAYGYDDPFKNNNSTYGDDGFYHEGGQKKKIRIETLNDRSNDNRYELSNGSRNKDKSISNIMLDQLQTR